MSTLNQTQSAKKRWIFEIRQTQPSGDVVTVLIM